MGTLFGDGCISGPCSGDVGAAGGLDVGNRLSGSLLLSP